MTLTFISRIPNARYYFVEDKTKVLGAVAYDMLSGEVHTVHAKVVVWATGGSARTLPSLRTARRILATPLASCCATACHWKIWNSSNSTQPALAGLGILVTEGARGEGGYLTNSEGERFMERYAPTVKDLAPRDMVAQCMYKEVLEGRGINKTGKIGEGDYVYMNLMHLGKEELMKKLPEISDFATTYLGHQTVGRTGSGDADCALYHGRHSNRQRWSGEAQRSRRYR